MSGAKGRSGRRCKATCARNDRVYVALDTITQVFVRVNGKGVMFDLHTDGEYVVRWINSEGLYKEKRTLDFTAAAAEFVRRVNGK